MTSALFKNETLEIKVIKFSKVDITGFLDLFKVNQFLYFVSNIFTEIDQIFGHNSAQPP